MWNERYAQPGFTYGTLPNDFLAESAARVFPPKGELLSLGEGEGRNAVYLAGLGFRVTAVDGSEVGLGKARALAAERGVSIQTVVSDLADYDFGTERWDGIVSIWCHTPPPLRARLHRAAVKALKPGGVFLLEGYTPKQLEYRTGGPDSERMMVRLEDLREELAGLEFLRLEELVRDVQEGAYHSGPSAVLQVLARKP